MGLIVIGVRVIIVLIVVYLVIKGYIKHKEEQRQKRFNNEVEKYFKEKL